MRRITPAAATNANDIHVHCSASNSVGGETFETRSTPVTTRETSYGPSTANNTCAARADAATTSAERTVTSERAYATPIATGMSHTKRKLATPEVGVPTANRIASTAVAA